MKTQNPSEEKTSKDSTLEKNVSIGNNFFSMIAAICAIIGALYGGCEWYTKRNADPPGGKAPVQSDVPPQEKAFSLPLPKPAAHHEPTGRNTHPAPQVNPPQGNGTDKEEGPEITRAEKKSNQAIANPAGVRENVLANKEEALQKRYAGLINRRHRNKDGQSDVGIFIRKGNRLDATFAACLSDAWSDLGINSSTGIFTSKAVRYYEDFYDGTPSFLTAARVVEQIDYYLIGEIEAEVRQNPSVEDMKTATIYFTGRLVSAKDGSPTPLNITPEREVGISDQDALREVYKSFAQKLAEEVKKHL